MLEGLRYSKGYIWFGIFIGLSCYVYSLILEHWWGVLIGIMVMGIQLTKIGPIKKEQIKARGQWEK